MGREKAEPSEASVQLVSNNGLHLRRTRLPFPPHFHLVEEGRTRFERLLQVWRVSEYKVSLKQLQFLISVEDSQEAASGLSIIACHGHTGLEDFCLL